MLKNILSGVIILFITLSIFSFLFDQSFQYSIKKAIKKSSQKLQTSIEKIGVSKNLSCENFFLELIPKKFNLSLPYYKWVGNPNIQCKRWFPFTYGYEMVNNYECFFRRGSDKHKNINYLYLEDNTFLYYNETVTYADGTIKGYNSFKFKPVLKPVPNSKYTKYFGLGSIDYQQYDLINLDFISCEMA